MKRATLRSLNDYCLAWTTTLPFPGAGPKEEEVSTSTRVPSNSPRSRRGTTTNAGEFRKKRARFFTDCFGMEKYLLPEFQRVVPEARERGNEREGE